MAPSIDLSKFVGKKVYIVLADGRTSIVKIGITPGAEESATYRYVLLDEDNPFGLHGLTYTREGRYRVYHENDPSHIVSIQEIILGQAYPNIGLDRLVGQEVYVICKNQLNDYQGFSSKLIGKVVKDVSSEYFIGGKLFSQNGQKARTDTSNYIVEIYPLTAIKIKTFGVEDPADPEVERAKELLRSLSSEQITAVINTFRVDSKNR